MSVAGLWAGAHALIMADLNQKLIMADLNQTFNMADLNHKLNMTDPNQHFDGQTIKMYYMVFKINQQLFKLIHKYINEYANHIH